MKGSNDSENANPSRLVCVFGFKAFCKQLAKCGAIVALRGILLTPLQTVNFPFSFQRTSRSYTDLSILVLNGRLNPKFPPPTGK